MAEIGVILLMFGVGMHFHPQELLRVWRIAVPGAVAQSAVAAAAGWALARAFGWSNAAGLVFGMALAVASTVVLMRMLVEQGRLDGRDGHVAVGWLIVEDLFTVAALVVLPTLALELSSAKSSVHALGIALGKVALFAALVWALGTRIVAAAMERVAKTRSTELFTLSVFVVALGIALLAAVVFNVSVALGAFLGGLVVGQSRFGPQAAADIAPFRDVFSALFFVSVGMLFNPLFVLEQPLLFLGALGIVLLVKPLVAVAIVLLLRDPPRTALTVAVGLAQIGEFSFILAALGTQRGLLPQAGFDALVAAAIASIAINPLLFRAQRRRACRVQRAHCRRPPPDRALRQGWPAAHRRDERAGSIAGTARARHRCGLWRSGPARSAARGGAGGRPDDRRHQSVADGEDAHLRRSARAQSAHRHRRYRGRGRRARLAAGVRRHLHLRSARRGERRPAPGHPRRALAI
jgi:CPA2 family monovalent cation:H+ antiporter-2